VYPSPSPILAYLHDCYRDNSNRGGLWHFFADSVSHRVFLPETDFLATFPDPFEELYLRDATARQAAEQAHWQRKEKDLIYGSWFLLGWVERNEGQRELACSPMVLCPAQWRTEGLEFGASLTVDLGRVQLNMPLLEAIGGQEFAQKIETLLDTQRFGVSSAAAVTCLLHEILPEADTEAMINYPHLMSASALKQRYRDQKANPTAPLSLLPVAALALIPKSTELRGVLNELHSMSTNIPDLSQPIQSLFGAAAIGPKSVSSGLVPTMLSEPQKRVLQSAEQHPITLVIGPPGTGKSFTIAALALQTMSSGGSVLIASKMDQAVNVVAEKIESSLGLDGVVTRGGRHHYLRQLQTFVEHLLAGMFVADAPQWNELEQLERRITNLRVTLRRLEKKLTQALQREEANGWLFVTNQLPMFARLKKVLATQRLRSRTPIWELAEQLEQQQDALQGLMLDYLKARRAYELNHALETDRSSLQIFARALKARSGTRKENYFQEVHLQTLLRALPIWLVNVSDVHRVLPLQKESFDLVIIDEASQCDLASSMPLLQRGKRAVVVGDPQQLRHLSFLSTQQQNRLAIQHGLDEAQAKHFNFRDVSLLDLASEAIHDQGQITFLNEHFRSAPEIIAFSNRQFYSNQLRIMTQHRELTPHFNLPPLQLNHLQFGKREADAVNRDELQSLLQALESLSESQQDFPREWVSSVGILSPFRAQVDAFMAVIQQHPKALVFQQRHRLLIGTAHSFQGEERDVMLLSLVLDDDSAKMSFRFLENRNLLNVSLTRARIAQQVWYSFDPRRLPEPSLVRDYLLQFANSKGVTGERRNSNRSHTGLDRFAHEVQQVLVEAGAQVAVAQTIGGLEIDLLYERNQCSRGIDLIGFPGSTHSAFPLPTLRLMRRAGLKVLPLPYSRWQTDREKCVRWLLDETKSPDSN
jgi:hypothetical protein